MSDPAAFAAFGRSKDSMRPELTPEGEIALECWKFCDGWHPDLIGYAAAYYGVDDVDMLTEALLTIRATAARCRIDEK